MNSRAKGARGERALSHKLQEYGYDTSREGWKQSRGAEVADVEGVEGMHIECKWVERLNIHEALNQSIKDAQANEIPVVMHKRNKDIWKVTMRLDDFMEIWRAYDEERKRTTE